MPKLNSEKQTLKVLEMVLRMETKELAHFVGLRAPKVSSTIKKQLQSLFRTALLIAREKDRAADLEDI